MAEIEKNFKIIKSNFDNVNKCWGTFTVSASEFANSLATSFTDTAPIKEELPFLLKLKCPECGGGVDKNTLTCKYCGLEFMLKER